MVVSFRGLVVAMLIVRYSSGKVPDLRQSIAHKLRK